MDDTTRIAIAAKEANSSQTRLVLVGLLFIDNIPIGSPLQRMSDEPFLPPCFKRFDAGVGDHESE